MKNVPNIVQFKTKYKEIVQKLVQIRKQSGTNQQQMADWLNVDRRKIIAFENLKKIDLETLLNYSHKMSIEVKLNFFIN